jgi:nucleoside-diphosphate-sugar epimerase
MKRTIVTGATGFVGANLARRLLADGHKVHLFVRPQHRTWRIEAIRSAVQVHSVDFADEERLTRLVSEIRPDWIFHLAAYGAYATQTNLQQMIQTNIVGTVNLVETCLRSGFEAFVNTGSSSEYGFKGDAPAENAWLEPNSHYAVTKASATMFCRYTAQSRGVHLPTLRLYSVYGPYEEPTRLLPTVITRGLAGELPSLAHPDIARDYVYVDDVNEAYIRAASHPTQELGAVYNVGTGTQTTLREVVEVAGRMLGVTAEPQWGSMPKRVWDTTVWIADSRKIQDALAWQPRFAFEDGFRAIVEWFRGNPGVHPYDNDRTTSA